jgi:hypothetical protein
VQGRSERLVTRCPRLEPVRQAGTSIERAESVSAKDNLGLALVGLGAFLVWPRVLVLVMYLTMLFLYALLARWEEARCSELFGEAYRAYERRTGMFLPRPLPRLGRWPASRRARVAAVLGLYVLAVVGGVGLAYRVRDYSLSKLSALFEDDMAVLSPARLSADELRGAVGAARAEPDVRAQIGEPGPRTGKLLVYVLPETWSIADLPLNPPSAATHPGTDRGHHAPSDFDRTRYRVLFTRAQSHDPEARGPAIVTTAYGREPIIVVRVDIASGKVTGVDTPPPHVRWGDISTPLF